MPIRTTATKRCEFMTSGRLVKAIIRADPRQCRGRSTLLGAVLSCSKGGGMMAATTAEYHSPWLCTYEPRIQAIAVRRSLHDGITGLRLSKVELRVNGVNVHLPFEP